MRLDQRLNLVVPIERQDGATLFVHSTPVSRQVFEAHYRVIGRAHAQIKADMESLRSGPRVAALALRDAAKRFDLADATEHGLLAEIRRLTNVVLPTPAGNTVLPLETASERGLLDADEAAEIEGYTAFFTVISTMERKKTAAAILTLMGDLWETATSSLNSTDFAASLKTSTAAENTGATTETPPAALESVSRIPY